MANESLLLAYETELIGRMIFNKDVYFENADVITEDIFQHHKDLFRAFHDLVTEGKHPGVHRMLEKVPSKAATIKKASLEGDFSIPLNDILGELTESSKVLKLKRAMLKASSMPSSDEIINTVTNAIVNVNKEDKAQFETGFDVAVQMIKALDTQAQTGVPTGFRKFDELTGGLQPSDLVILAAESSIGKTALSLNIAENVMEAGAGVCFISLEMSKIQIMSRMVIAKSGVPRQEMRENLELITNVASQYKDQPFYVTDVTDNREQYILGLIRGAVLRHKVKVAVVDYLQLVQGSDSRQSREQEVGRIARNLKNLAKELDITIIALSQLNRPKFGTGTHPHYPTMSRLRDSGQIEEAADIIWFIYRPEQHGITEDEQGNSTEGVAYMIIAKGRNYGTTSFKSRFEKKIAKFSEWESGSRPGDFGLPPNYSFDGDEPLPF